MTRQAFIYLFLFLFMGVAGTGCYGCFTFGSSDEESSETTETEENERDDEGPQDLAEALEGIDDALQEALGGEGGTVKEAVNFRKLKDLLPNRVGRLDRESAEGESNNVMGMRFSNAKGRYEDGRSSLEISISDLGTLTGIARMGFAAWLQAEIDRESDRGFERTRKFRSGGKEYPSFEKFEGEDDEGNCEIQIWVAERFIVGINGRNVEMEQCEEARDEISYRQLDRLRNEGREES